MHTMFSHRMKMLAKFIFASVMLVIITACSTTPERNILPVHLISQAAIPGVPDARFWGDEWPTFSLERFNSYTDADLKKHFSSAYDSPHNYLDRLFHIGQYLVVEHREVKGETESDCVAGSKVGDGQFSA